MEETFVDEFSVAIKIIELADYYHQLNDESKNVFNQYLSDEYAGQEDDAFNHITTSLIDILYMSFHSREDLETYLSDLSETTNLKYFDMVLDSTLEYIKDLISDIQMIGYE